MLEARWDKVNNRPETLWIKTAVSLVTADSIMIGYERGVFEMLSHSYARLGRGSAHLQIIFIFYTVSQLSSNWGFPNSRFSHLLVAVGDVSDLIPREGALGCQPIVGLIDVQTQGIHSQKKIGSLFILKRIGRVNKAFLPSCLFRDTS